MPAFLIRETTVCLRGQGGRSLLLFPCIVSFGWYDWHGTVHEGYELTETNEEKCRHFLLFDRGEGQEVDEDHREQKSRRKGGFYQ